MATYLDHVYNLVEFLEIFKFFQKVIQFEMKTFKNFKIKHTFKTKKIEYVWN